MRSKLEGLIFRHFLAENRILGCLGDILEGSWAVWAKILNRLGPQLGSNSDPKMALELPKSPSRRPRADGVPLLGSVSLLRLVIVLFSCGSWAHLGVVLGAKTGVLGAQDGPIILPRRPKMPLSCLQDSPRSDFQPKSKEK